MSLELIETCMKDYPLHTPDCVIKFRETHAIFIGWFSRGDGFTQRKESDLLELQIEGQTCYINSIQLQRENCGVGLGYALYMKAEEIARALKCTSMQMTPSGWVLGAGENAGETRMDYCIRKLRYWQISEWEVCKRL
jgi:hypothetical protein